MTYFVEGLIKLHAGQTEVRRIGEYQTLEDAIGASKHVIDQFLVGILDPEMTAADLFSKYSDLGEVPIIFDDGERTLNVTGFNHYSYAMNRCGVMCARKVKAPPAWECGATRRAAALRK
ncbi:MAG: hypothetical protein H7144_15770 [Burkholderiales bacterium]|nr:hypothetical protein [Phycisphaerae bacterium]